MDPTTILRQWTAARNEALDAELYKVDSHHAGRLGLSGLAALMAALDVVSRVEGRMTAGEIMLALTPAAQAAIGEATERLRIVADDANLSIPGVGSVPAVLLERDHVTAAEVVRRAASAMGSASSARKTAAARVNGRRGGRPRLSLYERAERRVDRSPTLSKHKAFIMDDWPLGDEHWQWVCTARVSEIVAWVIACSD